MGEMMMTLICVEISSQNENRFVLVMTPPVVTPMIIMIVTKIKVTTRNVIPTFINAMVEISMRMMILIKSTKTNAIINAPCDVDQFQTQAVDQEVRSQRVVVHPHRERFQRAVADCLPEHNLILVG